MNNTTMFYVGIDVSKDKSDICIKYEIIESIKSKRSGNSDVVIGMEATGIGGIKAYLDVWNRCPKPFVWTKTSDEILAKAKPNIINHTSDIG